MGGEPSFGRRIQPLPPQADQVLVERLSRVPVACISDVMMRLVAGGPTLRPVGAAAFCGTAVTVRVPPGDNLLVHKALELVRPGDVLVVDAGGDLTNAIIGERMYSVAVAAGVAAVVIHGAIRDLRALRAGEVPVFASGVTHRGPYKNGPGEINCPIAIGGMVIMPGDVVAGDDDGLVSIPVVDLPAICDAAEAKDLWERENPPQTGDRSWIDAAIGKLGYLLA